MDPNTAWDDDPHVFKHNHTEKKFLSDLALTTDYISVVLSVLVVLADVLLIAVILRYRRLRTRSNYYMLNFAIFHILYIISTPCFYFILDLFYGSQLEVHWYCTWIRLENLGIGLGLTFVTGFGGDTYLEAQKFNWFKKYEERYLYVFYFFYFTHFLIYLISGGICFNSGIGNNFNFYFLTFYYIVLLTITIYIYYKQRKLTTIHSKRFTIEVSLMVLLIWLPLHIWYNAINIFFGKVYVTDIVLWYSAFVPEFLAYLSSVMVVWKLWKSNKHYKIAFRKILRMPVSNVDYEELNVNETCV